MTQPAVTIIELDGSLGVLPPSAGALFALMGTSSTGTVNAPATYGRGKDVISAFGAGPLVEAACHYIERYGKPVIVVRTGNTTASAFSAIDVTGVTGTSVITKDAGATANDDYEAYVIFTAGGTRGVAGIAYQESLDGGRTLSPVKALGTAVAITITGSGGITLNLAAGTIVAGDVVTIRSTAPCFNGTEITSAIVALKNSIATWELLEICNPLDGTLFDAVETAFAGMATVGKFRAWIGNTRVPTIGESEATYKAALDTIFSARSSIVGMLCAGACKLTSSVSGRKYKRPVSFAIAAREASVSQEINTANVNLGAFVGVSITDSNGNVDEHNESVSPGLDDSRFTVFRTWDGLQGVFVNRPRIFSSAGSDFTIMPYRRVINLAEGALRNYFIRRLALPVLVSPTTGFILETEALEIEAGAEAAMSSVLLDAPKASGVQFTLSRTDNILSTKTLTGDARVLPLAYPEFINVTVGFVNPAIQVQAAA